MSFIAALLTAMSGMAVRGGPVVLHVKPPFNPILSKLHKPNAK
jgi:hypothetical protein